MRVKAITNFAGAVTMHEGEIRTCRETSIIRELMEAGYIEVLEETDTRKAGKKK